MYKSLITPIAVLGTIASLMTIAPPPAQALPEAQIVEKLQEIPVFTITNGKGLFFQSVKVADKNRLITPVYMELKDAELFLKTLKKKQSPQSKVAQISTVRLSEIYKWQVEAQKKSDNVSFVFIPTEQQLKNAKLLQKPYQANASYPVPLFMIAIKQQDKYVTVQENNLTPLFLDKQQAQQWLEKVRKQDPKLVAKAEIKVHYLQNVLQDLHGKNYPAQQQLVLVPSTKSLDIIRKLQAAQKPAANPAASPATSPATTTPKK
jgi:predicted double-glycine peptidase